MQVTPYLFFNGNCQEALSFYHGIFGGKLHLMTYGEQIGPGCPLATKDKIMHGAVTVGDFLLMASDAFDAAPTKGTTVRLSLNCQSLEDIERIYTKLVEGGVVCHALQDMPWGDRFGTLEDKFGMEWMLNCSLKAKK